MITRLAVLHQANLLQLHAGEQVAVEPRHQQLAVQISLGLTRHVARSQSLNQRVCVAASATIRMPSDASSTKATDPQHPSKSSHVISGGPEGRLHELRTPDRC